MVSLANRVWLLAQRREARRFAHACKHPRDAQESLLRGYIKCNLPRGVTTVGEFRARLPLVTWDEHPVHLREPVLFHEETSGSSGLFQIGSHISRYVSGCRSSWIGRIRWIEWQRRSEISAMMG